MARCAMFGIMIILELGLQMSTMQVCLGSSFGSDCMCITSYHLRRCVFVGFVSTAGTAGSTRS